MNRINLDPVTCEGCGRLMPECDFEWHCCSSELRIAQLERDLAAAEEAIRIARRGWFLHDAPHDWERLPAVQKALEGAR